MVKQCDVFVRSRFISHQIIKHQPIERKDKLYGKTQLRKWYCPVTKIAGVDQEMITDLLNAGKFVSVVGWVTHTLNLKKEISEIDHSTSVVLKSNLVDTI